MPDNETLTLLAMEGSFSHDHIIVQSLSPKKTFHLAAISIHEIVFRLAARHRNKSQSMCYIASPGASKPQAVAVWDLFIVKGKAQVMTILQ